MPQQPANIIKFFDNRFACNANSQPDQFQNSQTVKSSVCYAPSALRNLGSCLLLVSANRVIFPDFTELPRRDSEPTVFEEHEAELAPLIRIIFKQHRRRYGARRIASELKDHGHQCGARKVSRVMKTLGLRAIQPRSCVPKTTNSRHRF